MTTPTPQALATALTTLADTLTPADAATLRAAAALLREQEARLERVEALLKKWEEGTERVMQRALAQDDMQEAVRLAGLVGAREYCNDTLRAALAQAPAGQEGGWGSDGSKRQNARG